MAHADMRMTLGHTRQPEAGLQTELSAQVAIGIRLSKGATSNRSRVGVRLSSVETGREHNVPLY